MTDKFIPFNPETAKNGDIVYGCYSKAEFIYVGPTPIRGHDKFVIVYDVANELYKAMPSDNLRITVPKKTVWINVYSKGIPCFYYETERAATDNANKEAKTYIGTYPLEIDDVA